MASLYDILKLDWPNAVLNFPEDFDPLDAILLVKGVYHTDEGSLTRPVWCHRFTEGLVQNPGETLGQLIMAAHMIKVELAEEYTHDDPTD